jgi:hypothetical protein
MKIVLLVRFVLAYLTKIRLLVNWVKLEICDKFDFILELLGFIIHFKEII